MKTKSKKVSWRIAKKIMENIIIVENPDKYWWIKNEHYDIYDTVGLMTNDEYNKHVLHKNPTFYQAELRRLTYKQIMTLTKGKGIAERMGDAYAQCPYCGKNEWWLLPVKTLEVREGGKNYCACLNCGYQTHL